MKSHREALTQASESDAPLSLCSLDLLDEYDVDGRATRCGKILLKSGADPTITDGDMEPPVVTAMMFSPVGTRISRHAAWGCFELLTTADNSHFDLG